MFDVFIDSLIDSLIVLAVLFVVNFITAFFESKINDTLEKSKRWSPLLGGFFGLLPQCSFSVVATDLYQKKHITMGTLIAVFIATSDEALPILLSHPENYLQLIILLALKFVIGVIVGFIVDGIFNKKVEEVGLHEEHCEHEEEVHFGCCSHEIEEDSKVKRYLLHPLLHSVKIFAYVFVINFLFGLLVYFVGVDNISAFLTANKYFTPLYAIIIGLIPNCAASILITNLFVLKAISFGSLLSGLIVNAGLGVMLLFKDKKNMKNNFLIVGILIFVAIITGYVTSLITGF